MKFFLKRDKKLHDRAFRGYVNPKNNLVLYTSYGYKAGDDKISDTLLKGLVAHEVQHYRQGLERPNRHKTSLAIDLILDEMEAYVIQDMVFMGKLLNGSDPIDKESISVLEKIAFRYGVKPSCFLNNVNTDRFVTANDLYRSLVYILKDKEVSQGLTDYYLYHHIKKYAEKISVISMGDMQKGLRDMRKTLFNELSQVNF